MEHPSDPQQENSVLDLLMGLTFVLAVIESLSSRHLIEIHPWGVTAQASRFVDEDLSW
jgi:hypothetical protein